jgi:hypothetical protein
MKVAREVFDAAHKVCLMSEEIYPQWLLALAWHYTSCNPSIIKPTGGRWAEGIVDDPELLKLLGSDLGMFLRPAEEVLGSTPQVFAQPCLWAAAIDDYLSDPVKQMALEHRELQCLYHKHLRGLQELFNLYLSRRAGYSNVQSLLPEVKGLLATNQAMKSALALYQSQEVAHGTIQ